MDNKIIAIIIVAILAVAGVGVVLLNSSNNNDNGTGEYEDMTGKMVEMPGTVNSIAVIGVGSLRVMSHLGLADKICASDQLAGGVTYGSNTYMYAFEDLYGNPIVKNNSGERQAVNLEKILTCNNGSMPDVLVIVDTVASSNASTIESLERAGVTVFRIESVQELMDDDYTISDKYEKQLTLLGKAFKVENRAKEIIQGVNGMMKEIRDIAVEKSYNGSVYIGGLTVATLRGLNVSSIDYTPFKIIGANNILKTGNPAMDAGGTQAGVSVQVEGVINLINNSSGLTMFVDPAGWRLNGGLCTGDNVISSALSNKGITSGLVLTPFHSYGMEYDNILVNCYLVAGAVFGLDEEYISERIQDVYDLYYKDAAYDSNGVSIYERMSEWYFNAIHCEFGKSVSFGNLQITMTDGTVYT